MNLDAIKNHALLLSMNDRFFLAQTLLESLDNIDFKIKILDCVGASSMYYSTISLRRLAKIFILKSISIGQPINYEKKWINEAKNRYKAFSQGTIKGIDENLVFQETFERIQ